MVEAEQVANGLCWHIKWLSLSSWEYVENGFLCFWVVLPITICWVDSWTTPAITGKANRLDMKGAAIVSVFPALGLFTAINAGIAPSWFNDAEVDKALDG